MDTETLVLLLVSLHVVLLALCLGGLIRDFSQTVFQRIAQGLIALVIPVLGPIGILCFLVSAHDLKELKFILPFPFYFFGSDHALEDRRRESGYEINHHMDTLD